MSGEKKNVLAVCARYYVADDGGYLENTLLDDERYEPRVINKQIINERMRSHINQIFYADLLRTLRLTIA